MIVLFSYNIFDKLKRRRVVSTALGYDVIQAYRYDAAGAVASMDLPQGRETSVPRLSYGYDPFHRLSGIAFVAGTDSLPVVRNVAYRQNDLLASFGLGGHLAVTNAYETQRPLLTSLLAKQDTSTIYRQGYAYDEVGNIVGMRRFSGDSAGYDYDKLYQLRNVRYPMGNTDNRPANLAYTYDANGNRTSFGHDFTSKSKPEWLAYQPGTGTTVGSNHLSVGWSGREGYTGYGYDYRGNLISEKSFGDSASMVAGTNAWKDRTRRFNRRNELERLFSTTRQAGGDSSGWAYDYDEKGDRIEKRRSSLPDTTWSVNRKYAYDGTSVVADSSVGDTAWVYSVVMDLKRVARVRRDANKKWQVQYLVTDHLGTANLVTDSLGSVLQRNVLDPWGNMEMAVGSAPIPYLYTGKEWEPEGGVYYFNARWYSPERGMFTGRDPQLQFWSPYAYVGNMPLTGVDPTGREVTYSLGCSEQNSDVEVLNIHLTGVVTDNTAEGMGDLHSVRDWIQNRLQNQWTVTADSKESIHLEANLALEGTERPRMPNDHVFEIVDLLKNPDDKYSEAVMGNSEIGGNHVSLTRSALSLEGQRTIGHEFGHTMGLLHDADESQPNIMWQSVFTGSTRITPAIYSQLRGWAQ